MPRRSRLAPHPIPKHGFTLVELVVTMAVMVVLAAVMVPSMDTFAANNQVASTKSSFATAVALARTEAVRRGRAVFVQAIGSGPSGNEFLNGWEVVVDDDGNGSPGSTETRVRSMATRLDKVKLGGTAILGFQASGALVGTAAQVYRVCRVSGSTAGYSVTVSPSGVADVQAINTCS
jgi:type IV fimbrial biogenesis protein FimT